MVIVASGPGKHSTITPTFGATRSVTVSIGDRRAHPSTGEAVMSLCRVKRR